MHRRLRTAGMATAAVLLGLTGRDPIPGRFEIAPLEADRRRVRFDDDWRFFQGDPSGAEQPEFDDRSWRMLDLPHDWAIEGSFDSSLDPRMGALPTSGVGWYRRRFPVPASRETVHYSIEFDGAMSNATVWLNGRELGSRPYGYIGFAFDLTPHLRPGAENVLAVRLAPEVRSSRWYEPGTLEAIAYNGGRSVARHRRRTAGPAARIALLPDRPTIVADGEDLGFVTARIEDSEGTLVPDADHRIRFEVEGAGRIVAVDNGNPASVESFQGPERKAFSGLALLIVRSYRGQSGSVTISATADDLAPGNAVVLATRP